jgi:rhodanese-related sulfurtransferase
MEMVSVQEAAEARTRGEMMIDVRNPDEYAGGHVPGSVLMPLPMVPLRLSELRTDAPVYLVCESGSRSYQACMFLEARGYQVVNVHGGMSNWRAAGLPLETGDGHT